MTEFSTFFLMGYDDYLISGICVSALLLALARYLFKGRIEIAAAVQILRWVIVVYGILTILRFAIGPGFSQLFTSSRATGEYWWAYWLMYLSATIVPLLFLVPRIGSSILAIFIAGFLMNMGRIFESIMIHMINIQGREYATDNNYHNPYLPYPQESLTLLLGVAIGLLALLIVNVARKWKRLRSENA